MADFKLATEIVDLPSKGYLYSKDSSLADGKIEIKYMTAKEEDILTNSSYIQKGTVLDKLFQSLIVSKIDYNELLIGDKNAIMIAARILGYGKDYAFTYEGVEETVDLTEVNNSEIDDDLFKSGKNEFSFTFPHSGNEITFKLLNHGDETKIQRELDGLKKIDKNSDPTLTTRLKHTILSVEGKTEKKDIREFVDKYLLARDARALREYIKSISPDVDLTFFPLVAKQQKPFQLGLDFFGLTLENSPVYRKNLFTQIHNIVFHGNGGYDWFTIYNMPIWLRKFTFHEINEYNKDQNEKANSTKNKDSLVNTKGQVNQPKFQNKTSYK